MEVPIEKDLADAVERGDIDEWQAMTAQTCRDAAYARTKADELQKKMDELEKSSPPPEPKKKFINLVSRGG